MDSGSIFICYRRDDSIAYAGRLHDRLVGQFGKNQVFMDVDTIQPGDDFVEIVERRVSSSSVLIAIIGKSWLSLTDARGNRRLDDPNDYVRREIAAALGQQVRIIPALVGGAQMPRPTDLPEEIAPLARRNAIEISDTAFPASVSKLVDALTAAIDADRARRHAERAAADATDASVHPETPAAHNAPGLTSAQKLAAMIGAAAAGLAIVVWLLLGANSRETADTQPERPETPAESVISPEPARDSPVQVGGEITPPLKTKDVPPTYPPIAQAARVEGVVSIAVTIDPAGKVQDARVVRSIPLLDAAALDAVRQWEYAPTVVDGMPRSVTMTVNVQFSGN